MIPELKAKELIEKFIPYCGDYRTGDKNSFENAKACAIICVDEIINCVEVQEYETAVEYWQQVKQIIKQQ